MTTEDKQLRLDYYKHIMGGVAVTYEDIPHEWRVHLSTLNNMKLYAPLLHRRYHAWIMAGKDSNNFSGGVVRDYGCDRKTPWRFLKQF